MYVYEKHILSIKLLKIRIYHWFTLEFLYNGQSRSLSSVLSVCDSKKLLGQVPSVHNMSGMKCIALHCHCVLEPGCNIMCSFCSFPLGTAEILNWLVYFLIFSGSFSCLCAAAWYLLVIFQETFFPFFFFLQTSRLKPAEGTVKVRIYTCFYV